MNAEYQRLEAEASDVERQMRIVSSSVELSSASGHAEYERQIGDLARKLASLRHGMALIRAMNSQELRRRERDFVKALPKKFHSQGIREKVVHLPGRVTVTLSVTYYHRCQSGGTGRRGLFPMLMLLGIAGHYTPLTRKCMAKAAALLGSFEEAVEMLAEGGIHVSANQLRDVTAGMGQMLQDRKRGQEKLPCGFVDYSDHRDLRATVAVPPRAQKKDWAGSDGAKKARVSSLSLKRVVIANLV